MGKQDSPADTSKIAWCCNKKNGISLVELNENLSQGYINEADQTLESLGAVKGKWSLIMGYYACYNALYSLLMRSGIKSEIHECSIALMKIIPQFSDDDMQFINNLKKDRIDVQYYLKDKTLEDIGRVKEFILKCKQAREELDVDSLRANISKIIDGGKN